MYDHQRYAVYHANNVFEMALPPAARWYADQSRYYTYVADVVASLEQVFALTNHIDHPWTDNPEVAWHTTAQVRSTSVGDIIVSRESGGVWLIMPVGLRELTLTNGIHTGNEEGTTSATSMMQHELHVPFGLSQVANYEEVSRRYAATIPDLAKNTPLPPALPSRHPALEQLEGRYAVQDRLPPWWHGCVDALISECPCLEPLMRPTSLEEFRRGSIDQRRWNRWCNAECQLTEGQKPVPCRQHHGPGLYRIMAKVLPAQDRPLWLDRFIIRGDKDIPPELDLVITSALQWWLNMSNGRGWSSCMGAGSDRNPRITGNWYDTGVVLAALVARCADCWAPDCLIARTTVRLVVDDMPTALEQVVTERSALRLVLGQVYHNDLTSACNLLVSLVALFEERGLPWGCIVGTNTAQFAQDGSLGALTLEGEARKALGVPYWLPAATERPALEGQVTYLESDAQASGGSWTYPLFSVYPCHLRNPIPIKRALSHNSN